MNFGFVINNRTCIGCHACSTACKAENEVPLGVYRTWVKYTETGTYPDSKRHFQVTRCNHCSNPPCVRICPVTAMYQRDDGIVEFDGDQCIGCKACMQACPYDAIYIDPETHTAAKCHFCSHRTDLGLEPACVVVCPEHAIIAGDLDDPHSEISRVLAKEEVSVRKPEQGTAPKLFYVEGNDVNLHPTATERAPDQFMWADVLPLDGSAPLKRQAPAARGPRQDELVQIRTGPKAPNGTPIHPPRQQGVPATPIGLGRRSQAEQMVQVGYNAQHKVPWHWQVPAYLVTKAISAGAFMFAAAGALLGWFNLDSTGAIVGAALATVFAGITTVLLIADLERPERFLRIVFQPQWKSWLTRGAFILMGFAGIATLWLALELGGALGLASTALVTQLRPVVLGVGFPLAVGAAIYTAFLFGQAEGRDLWQSPLLPWHLFVQSAMAGAAGFLLIALVVPLPAALLGAAQTTLVISLCVDLFVTLFGELGMSHASEVAARAAHMISHGRYRIHFWVGAVGLGHAIPLGLLLLAPTTVAVAGAGAALATLAGLYLYEYAFVMAPQEIPNS